MGFNENIVKTSSITHFSYSPANGSHSSYLHIMAGSRELGYPPEVLNKRTRARLGSNSQTHQSTILQEWICHCCAVRMASPAMLQHIVLGGNSIMPY
jgi:hypothetical protein